MAKALFTHMISSLVLFALIGHASGQCGDDMVQIDIEAGRLPAQWNLGTIPHLFINSEHLRGVISIVDFKVSGLDTLQASLQFCPVTMTIYGDILASRVQLAGAYTSNLDYLTQGKDLLTHGQGILNLTLTNFRVRNLVAPIRYSRVVKKLQIDDIQYEANEEVVSPVITGFHIDGVNEHDANPEETIAIDKSNNMPTIVEFVRAVINTKTKGKILLNAVREMFLSAVAP